MTGHDPRFDDAAAAYLLHALEPEEADAFEAHLQTCTACRDEVEDLRMAADALPASPTQLAPPPELKDRIMAVVNAEAELLRGAEPSPPQRRRVAVLRRGWWSMRPALVAATAVAVLALGVLGGILVAGGSSSRTVTASAAPPGSKVKMIVRSDGHSTLVATGMPRAGSGRVYQVWLLKGKTPEPTNALFSTRTDGSASVDVPGSLRGVDAVLVTSEPDGGSRAPTRAPVVRVVPS